MKTIYNTPMVRTFSAHPARMMAMSLTGTTEETNAAAYLQSLEMEEEEIDW